MATKNVSTSRQLLDALAGASGGDRIVLAAGNYGNVSLAKHDFNGPVTLAGAGKAVFTGLALRDVANLTLDGLAFDYAPGKSPSETPFVVATSKNVTIRNADFDGHLAGGYGAGLGLKVTRSAQITVENSDFAKFQRGAFFLDVTGLTVRGNDMRLMSEDVLEFAQVIGARIERNHLYDMQTPPERKHKDLIQFWSAGTTKPSADVVIRDNVLESDEPLVHGIFLGNEIGRSNKSFKYQNILIENNKVTSGHVLGLVVEHSSKVTIRGNEVRIHPDLKKTSMNTPVIDVTPDSTGVVISGNTAHALPDKLGAGWTVTGNKLVTTSGTVSAAPDAGSVGTSGATGGTPAPADDGGTDFRFTGSQSKGKADTVRDLDFADGDRIILKDYAAGTLKGYGDDNYLAVNRAGTYAVLDSQADLAELAAASSAVTLAAAGDGQLLRISQPGGRHDIYLPAQGQSSAGTKSFGGTTTATSSTTTTTSGDGTDFRFDGAKSRGDTDTLRGLDFADGDRIILKNYATGTLKGYGDDNYLAVNRAGTYAVLDSLRDVAELDSASSAVTTRVSGDTLVLSITQSGSRHDIQLAGLGDEFLSL